MTLKSGATEQNYTGLTTDASGFFTVTVTGLADGGYNWRVKGPKYLANAGMLNLAAGSTSHVEMGLMRVGDCNNDNVVSIVDFGIIRAAFGTTVGDPSYDPRADLNGDNVISSQDINLLRGNIGIGGAPPLNPVGAPGT
jgi:hypothetical protein